MPTPEKITIFLKQFKRNLIRVFTFIEREKNLNTLTSIGLTLKNVKELLAQLTYENYVKGPEEDIDNPGYNIWIFGLAVQGEEIYIKLSDDFRWDVAKCISFHIAEYLINYPYKTPEQGGDTQ